MPERAAVAESPAESVAARFAERVPVPVGAKSTLMVQLWPAESDDPHVVLAFWKSAVFDPVKEIVRPVTEALVLFVTVKACVGVDPPTG